MGPLRSSEWITGLQTSWIPDAETSEVRVLFDYVDVDGDGSLNLSVSWASPWKVVDRLCLCRIDCPIFVFWLRLAIGAFGIPVWVRNSLSWFVRCGLESAQMLGPVLWDWGALFLNRSVVATSGVYDDSRILRRRQVKLNFALLVESLLW